MTPSVSLDKPEPEFICDCEEMARLSCSQERFYREDGAKKYCVLHFPGNDKGKAFQKALRRKLAAADYSFRGVWFPNEVIFRGFHFSSTADFTNSTFSGEANFSNSTFAASANFHQATFVGPAFFHSANFSFVNFSNANFGPIVDFSFATFHAESYFLGTKFGDCANFVKTSFEGSEAQFWKSIFHAVSFYKSHFHSRVNFRHTVFNTGTDFGEVEWKKEVYFRNAIFKGAMSFCDTRFGLIADFGSATIEDGLEFERSKFSKATSLNFHYSSIEKPEKISFHSVRLRPHWFVNVNARQFRFVNVKWYGFPLGIRGRFFNLFTDSEQAKGLRQEINELQVKGVPAPHRLLAIACRDLAVNAEEGHRYGEAARFRYLAMDATRLETWRGFRPLKLSWWYWLASGYGERVFQAFLILILIWILFAFTYMNVGFMRWETRTSNEQDALAAVRDHTGSPLKSMDALTYSLAVMTLQKPEPRPATNAARTMVLLETILGPLQGALLALAVRRRFMR